MINLDNIRNIYLVGDLHLGLRNNSIEWSNIQREFLLDIMIREIDKDFNQDQDILIFEGDIFHNRESINVRIQNNALDIFSTLAKKFKRGIFIILGNHDSYYKDKTNVHSLRTLSNISNNIHIFDNHKILNINSKHKFLMLPWVEDINTMGDVILKHHNICQYIICHADIKGFSFNKWAKVEKGLDVKVLRPFRRVYSGHIHIKQDIGNILYTGTPYQMDRGDINSPKGFYKLVVNADSISEEYIVNNKSPKFVKYDLFDVLNMNLDQISGAFTNNFLDIMANVSVINKIAIPKLLDYIQDVKYRKLEFFTYSNDISKNVDFDNTKIDSNNFSIPDILKTYLETRNYNKDFEKQILDKFINLHNSIINEIPQV